jgi:UDP-N-acetyl-D-galactosamine dehydrogenase
VNVDVYDPWVNKQEANISYNVSVLDELPVGTYESVILTVAHKDFIDMGEDRIRSLCKESHLVYDLKNVLNGNADMSL